MSELALYPGSFDPVTNGHLDIIRRASGLYAHLVVAVARNTAKHAMFGVDERLGFLTHEIAALKKSGHLGGEVEVAHFDGLLMNYAESRKARVIIRGLRAVTDFDYEFQMTGMNRRMNPDIETVFLMASERHQFIAARMVKEVALLGGDISGFVPERVAAELGRKCGK